MSDVAQGGWHDFWAGSAGSVIAVAGGVCVGLLATLFLPQIHEAWPLPSLLGKEVEYGGPIVWQAVFFWISFAVFVVSLFFREFYRARAYKRERQELERNIEAVREVAQTMPPKDLLQVSAEQFQVVSRQTELVISSKDVLLGEKRHDEARSHLDHAIRALLDSIINLALKFDSPHGSPRPTYRANIMWVRRLDDVGEDEVREIVWGWAKRLAPVAAKDAFFAMVDRLLLLDCSLAVRTQLDDDQSENGPFEDDLEPLCLGFVMPDSSLANINLLGAPEALYTGGLAYVGESAGMASEIREAGREYGSDALDRVNRYYTKDSKGKSIISIPVTGPNFLQPTEAPITLAVLSIYRDECEIMGSSERAEMFYNEVTPFVHLLYRLCWARSDLDELEGAAPVRYSSRSRD